MKDRERSYSYDYCSYIILKGDPRYISDIYRDYLPSQFNVLQVAPLRF